MISRLDRAWQQPAHQASLNIADNVPGEFHTTLSKAKKSFEVLEHQVGAKVRVPCCSLLDAVAQGGARDATDKHRAGTAEHHAENSRASALLSFGEIGRE